MRIQHNIMAMNAYRNYNNNTKALSGNLEKLSSGYKINRAGDDAAGLAISEKMRAQITGLNAAQKNVKDGISLVKTAEGAMQEIQDMLNRMKYLATQSANGTYQDEVDRQNLQKEVNSLKAEIDRIADSANFNGRYLLNGSGGTGGNNSTTQLLTGAPTATVDNTNTTKLKATSGFTFETAATDVQKNAFNQALGENGAAIKVTFAKDAGNGTNSTTIEANDTFKIEGLDSITDFTFKFVAGDGTEVDMPTNGTLTVGANTDNDKVGPGAITINAYDGEGNKVGALKLGYDTTAGGVAAGNSTLTLTAPAAAAAAADGAGDAAATEAVKEKYSFSFAVGTALADGDEIQLGGTTILKVNDTATATDGTEISSTDAADAEKLGNAVATALGKQAAYKDDWNVTYDSANGKIVIEAKVAGKIDANNEAGKAPTAELTAVPALAMKAGGSGTLTVGTTLTKDATGADAADGNGGNNGGGNGFVSITLQIGDDNASYNQLTVKIGDMHITSMGQSFDMNLNTDGTTDYLMGQLPKSNTDPNAKLVNKTINDVDISTLQGAQEAIDIVKNAINYVSSVRGDLGATQNRLEHTQNNLSVMTENIQDAESTIRDTDVAEEMMSYTKNNILIQSAQAMLAQANQVPQGVLQLLG